MIEVNYYVKGIHVAMKYYHIKPKTLTHNINEEA